VDAFVRGSNENNVVVRFKCFLAIVRVNFSKICQTIIKDNVVVSVFCLADFFPLLFRLAERIIIKIHSEYGWSHTLFDIDICNSIYYWLKFQCDTSIVIAIAVIIHEFYLAVLRFRVNAVLSLARKFKVGHSSHKHI
jgi:hypothetical protein